MRPLLLTCLLSTVAFCAQMTGYISDAACGWNNARPGPEAKECAVKCVKAGWNPVFVRDGQMEVLKVNDNAKVLNFVGEHVTITGQIRSGILTISTIRRSAARPSPKRSNSAR